MTNELEKRLKEINLIDWTTVQSNILLKNILVELIILNDKVHTLFEEG